MAERQKDHGSMELSTIPWSGAEIILETVSRRKLSPIFHDLYILSRHSFNLFSLGRSKIFDAGGIHRLICALIYERERERERKIVAHGMELENKMVPRLERFKIDFGRDK